MQLTEKDKARFWSKVDVGEDHECWEWQAYKDKDGYGHFTFNRRNPGAHRVAYSIVNGDIKPGMVVMHSCDNRACVNPAHLSEGSHSDNVADKVAKNRAGVKLSHWEVKYIRELHERGHTGKQIAERYNVHWSTIYHILDRRTWTHI